MSNWISRSVLVLVAAFGLAIGTGCGSVYEDQNASMSSADDITKVKTLWSLAPELHTVAETRDQNQLKRMRTINYGQRSRKDDWQRVWLMERPSRLSSYPIP